MAEEKSRVFKSEAVQRLHSSDDLDKYIRVTNPSVWVLLIACIAMTAGLLVWGIRGAVTTSVSAVSVWDENRVLCFLDPKEMVTVHVGDLAVVNGEQMSVTSVAAAPISLNEVYEMLGRDYLAASVMDGEWAYIAVLTGKGGYTFGAYVPLETTITTERVAPISLVLNGE